jgi:coenzyme F420-reducing hydrogenase gamma subunit
MWNPFKKHDDIDWLLAELTVALSELSESVKELREEVDYLVDFLDD